MSRGALRIVLFISVAHALMHIYELALPSVEQLIGEEFQVAKWELGQLSTYFRFPIGAFAIVVGLLTDRWGGKSMLLIYLFGCAASCVAIALAPEFRWLLTSMVLLGIFDSIYHPTGLAYLSHEIPPESRTHALGIHGVFGSFGIASSPFFASAALASGMSWRGYYLALAIPGVLLGMAIALAASSGLRQRRYPAVQAGVSMSGEPRQSGLGDASLPPDRRARVTTEDGTPSAFHEEDETWWAGFFTVTVISALLGFIYAAFLSFLPRYLDVGSITTNYLQLPAASVRNLLAGAVLSLGMLGQYGSGRVARPGRLEPQLACVLFLQAPLLVAMAYVDGQFRVFIAAAFALVHFMAQPVHNSLIANYTHRRRRSVCYGFSFMMGFGVGSTGAMFAGASGTFITTQGYYLTLALLAACASLLAAGLAGAVRNRRGILD